MAVKKLYYSMGEVAEMFDVNRSLIRHWESKFDCLRPHKNQKGNRMFTPADIEKLKQIYHLVKEQGMTLDGARKAMKSPATKSLSRDAELLERLQRIRSALVEVREELKVGDGEQVVEASAPAWAEPEQGDEAPRAMRQGKAVTIIEGGDDAETDVDAKEKPKRRAPRRKKSDEEKELFPFYEQSLF